MTKPSLFWVDPTQLSDLVERVRSDRGTASRTRATKTAQRRADRTDHTPPTQVMGSPAHRPQAISEPLPEPFPEPPTGNLDERLTALLDRTKAMCSFEYAFVVDQEGLALVHESAPLELIAASAAMSESWDELRNRFDLAPDTRMTLALVGKRVLHLMTAPTRWGRLSFGIVVPAALAQSNIDNINSYFRRTLEQRSTQHDT